jgi:predicted O-methyltransferase YrrM
MSPEMGSKFLEIVYQRKPKNFLEIGVYTGVSARNICNLQSKLFNNDFNYFGIDLFEDYTPSDEREIAPNYIRGNNQYLSNPLKHLVYNIILKEQLNSLKSVQNFLKKYKNNIKLVKGNSIDVLPTIDLQIYDMMFIDGGHSYETISTELKLIHKRAKKNCLILVDDYFHNEAPGIKKAVDEIVKENNYKLKIHHNRFAEIIL